MKTTAIVTIAAAAAGVAAQAPTFPDGTPDCIALCGKNMLAKTDLGCSAGDLACLCPNKDFGYGVRDCTWAACNNNQGNVDTALQWLSAACAAVGKTLPPIPNTPGATAPAGTAGTAGTTNGAAGPAGTSNGAAGAATPTAVTTSLFTSVITDAAGAVTTQTGSTTINGLNGTPGATVVATSITGTVVVSGTGFTSTLGATTFETSATVVPSDVASSLSSAAAGSTSSSALGAQFTAAPAAGFLAAAGIAALLL